MQSLDLPEPIAAYFDADRADGQAVARCFTDDGHVLDEGRTHHGTAAIAAWKDATAAAAPYAVRPRAVTQDGRTYVVTGTVSGDFFGSPVDLRYTFTLARGRIASLEIAP